MLHGQKDVGVIRWKGIKREANTEGKEDEERQNETIFDSFPFGMQLCTITVYRKILGDIFEQCTFIMTSVCGTMKVRWIPMSSAEEENASYN